MRETVVRSAAVAAFAGVLAVGYVYWRRTRVPSKWKRVGTLENVYMSPLKSGYFAEQTEVICDVSGTRVSNKRLRDRSFMVVNAQGRFVTARTHPLLTQVKCDINDDDDEAVFSFVLTEEICTLAINFDEFEKKKPIKVNFGWDNDKRWIKVVDCGNEASEWIQSCIVTPDHQKDPSGIGTSLRLVYVVNDTLCSDRGLFFDETSYMLISQKSLEDLNTRLNVPVTMRNFRPNFVVSGTSQPYEEDEWKWVRIGDVIFQYIKPCLRCSFTTINADTGVKDAGMEPLKTLKSYRQITDPVLKRKAGEAPVFGAHYGLRSPAGHVVRKGDPVYINEN